MSSSKSMTMKKFVTLACEAIDSLSKKDAKATYKSIKSNSNKIWSHLHEAEKALSLKMELNEEVEDLEEEIEENPNNTAYVHDLNSLLCKASTIKLIRDLEIAFNQPPSSFAQITEKYKVNLHGHEHDSRSSSKSKPRKSSKPLMASTTKESTLDEDSDDVAENETFNYQAYFKLRESNMGALKHSSDEEEQDEQPELDESLPDKLLADHDRKQSKKAKSKQQDEVDEEVKLKEEEMDTYPVDENANYEVIAQHFKNDTTHNRDVEHSVLDFDDLQSIRLNDNDSEFADSQMSMSFTVPSQVSLLYTKYSNDKLPTASAKMNSASNSSSNYSSSDSEDIGHRRPPRPAKKTKKATQSNHRWSVDEESDLNENARRKMDSGSDDSTDSEQVAPLLSEAKRAPKRKRLYTDDDDEGELDANEEDDFYDGESALNIKSPIEEESKSWKDGVKSKLNGLKVIKTGFMSNAASNDKNSKKNQQQNGKKIANKLSPIPPKRKKPARPKPVKAKTPTPTSTKKKTKNESKKSDKKSSIKITKKPSTKSATHKQTKSDERKVSETKADDSDNGQTDEKLPAIALVSTLEKPWLDLKQRALDDHGWSGDDCERLIDETCMLNKKTVSVHSMWLLKCQNYCKEHKDATKNLKFAVFVGYPHGQQCIAAKVAEIKYCLKHNVSKITVFVASSKVAERDWTYIKKEVSLIHKAVNKKCALHFKYAENDKIGASTKGLFEKTISSIVNK